MRDNILDVNNFSLYIKSNKILSDLSFSVEKESITALSGKSGIGKTLLAHCIMRMQKEGIRTSGDIIFHGNKKAIVFQSPSCSLNPSYKIKRMVRRVLRINKISESDKNEILSFFPLNDILEKYPYQLSLGMAAKAALLLALLSGCDFLIMDETTSSLDDKSKREILTLIKEVKSKRPLTVLLITHEKSLSFSYCDKTLYLTENSITPLSSSSFKNIVFSPRQKEKNGEVILEVRNISKRYKRKEILKNISFSLHKNERVGIVGRSGAGKTLLLNIIAGLVEAESGSVFLYSHPFLTLNVRAKRRERGKFTYIHQDVYQALDDRFTVEKALKDTKSDLNIVKSLEKVSLDHSFLKRRISTLSGGERARVLLARAVQRKSDIIIIDEITANVDEELSFSLLDTVLSLFSSIIFVSHDENLIKTSMDRILLLENGRLFEK